jgi:glycosyltransferase involved in cell wall biosynthesis
MLAIVIPYYKKTFFRDTLQSLSDQTDKRFKVYIGNDASPESPDDLLLEFKDSLDITYHNFDENLGSQSLVLHWRRCLAMTADENWISILGDDDVYSDNVVELFYSHIDTIMEQNCKVVRYATQVIYQNNNSLSEVITHPEFESGIDFINRKFTKQSRSSLSEHFFKSTEIHSKGFVELPLAWHSDDVAIFTYSDHHKAIYSIDFYT